MTMCIGSVEHRDHHQWYDNSQLYRCKHHRWEHFGKWWRTSDWGSDIVHCKYLGGIHHNGVFHWVRILPTGQEEKQAQEIELLNTSRIQFNTLVWVNIIAGLTAKWIWLRSLLLLLRLLLLLLIRWHKRRRVTDTGTIGRQHTVTAISYTFVALCTSAHTAWWNRLTQHRAHHCLRSRALASLRAEWWGAALVNTHLILTARSWGLRYRTESHWKNKPLLETFHNGDWGWHTSLRLSWKRWIVPRIKWISGWIPLRKWISLWTPLIRDSCRTRLKKRIRSTNWAHYGKINWRNTRETQNRQQRTRRQNSHHFKF